MIGTLKQVRKENKFTFRDVMTFRIIYMKTEFRLRRKEWAKFKQKL
jgi:hypothetical protein